MNILIINLHSSQNAGDDVLTKVTVQQLHASFASPQLTLAMNDPDSYTGKDTVLGSFATWLKSPRGGWRVGGIFWLLLSFVIVMLYRLTKKRLLFMIPDGKRPLLQAYFDADLVVSSAGNFLYSSGRIGIPFLVSIYTMAYATWANKPLYTMPQTIGPLRKGWERWLVKWIVAKMRLLFVRDAISQANLERMGAWHHHCHLMPDVAFALAPASHEQGERLLRENEIRMSSRPLLGVTLINWGAQNRLFTSQHAYETAVSEVIRFFINRYDGHAVLFSQVTGPSASDDDRIPAQRVKQLLADMKTQVTFIGGTPTPETLKSAYGQMDVFIGSRLHSNIFALSETIPAIMIQYQPKTRGVVQMLELDSWVIEIENVTATSLIEMIQKLWSEKYHIRQQLKEIMPTIIEQASSVANKIAVNATHLL